MNKRLTKRDTDGQAMMDCQKCKADWPGKYGKPMADCTALYCRNRLLDRLVEYEDTGLTPEEIDMDHEAAETLRQLCRGYDLGRLVNLAEADKDGRVVVRPYRIDAAVYVLVKDEAVFYPETNGWYIGKETIGAITQNGFYLGDPEDGSFEPNDEIGKTVFFTYKEAAQALEGRNG